MSNKGILAHVKRMHSKSISPGWESIDVYQHMMMHMPEHRGSWMIFHHTHEGNL